MKENLEDRLVKFPELREQFERMLNIVENSGGEILRADDAEMRILDESQQMNSNVLTMWAQHREQSLAQHVENKKGTVKDVKKS